MKKHAIILAGGKGTRMKSDLPKCAYPFLGKPMAHYIVDACKRANIEDITIVVGYKKDMLIDSLRDEEDIHFVEQKEQLGTGHAALMAESRLLGEKGICLIFPGDMPLIDDEIINGLIDNHIESKNSLTVVTTIVDNPFGYGRIYREGGNVKRIIEEKDADSEQKKINEINSGLYCVDVELLFWALHQIKNKNVSNEYYLTDIIEILGKEYKVDSYQVNEAFKLTGINDLETLAKTESIFLKNK